MFNDVSLMLQGHLLCSCRKGSAALSHWDVCAGPVPEHTLGWFSWRQDQGRQTSNTGNCRQLPWFCLEICFSFLSLKSFLPLKKNKKIVNSQSRFFSPWTFFSPRTNSRQILWLCLEPTRIPPELRLKTICRRVLLTYTGRSYGPRQVLQMDALVAPI